MAGGPHRRRRSVDGFSAGPLDRAVALKLSLTVPPSGDLPSAALAALAQQAEALGYHALWVPESWGRDAFTLLARVAAATSTLRLGSGVVNVFSRSPALIAQSAASLDEISGGRFILGLGTSGPRVIEGWHGVPYDRPIRRLRQTVEMVRRVLRRDRLDGFKLLFHPVRAAIPIYLAALGPASLRLTGALADGWLPVFVPPARLDLLLEDVRAGEAERDPALGPLQKAVFVDVGVDADPPRARDLVRPHVALYVGGMGTFYNALVRRCGFEREAEAIAAAWARGERRTAATLVSDAMVDAFAVAGDAAACRERLGAYAEAGFDELILDVQAADPAKGLEAVEAMAPANS